jgi:hypothetical protein
METIMKKVPSKALPKKLGWTIMPGAINVIDLSYPIKPTGMSLLSVYPPLIIKAENPRRDKSYLKPATVDLKQDIL